MVERGRLTAAEEREVTRLLAEHAKRGNVRTEPCPRCGLRPVDHRTRQGWCRECSRQERRTRETRDANSTAVNDLARLGVLSAEAARLDEELRETVRRLKERGASWAQIGAALGVARQTAWERYTEG